MRNKAIHSIKTVLLLALILVMSLSALLVFSSCSNKGLSLDGIAKREEKVVNRIGDFTLGKSENFYNANGYSNGGIFNCTWRNDNVSYDGGALKIRFDYDKGDKSKYSSGEVRTHEFYGYGYYSVCMKPMNKVGILSSFFTYTGKSDKNPHDEIDIEFLGKDMTSVQFNYHTDGKSGNEYIYKLGFDASEDYHVYGFDWRKDKIVWYVDGEPVYAADKNIPTTPGRIMMNLWNPTGIGQNMWVGNFDKNSGIPGTAAYKWVSYTAD